MPTHADTLADLSRLALISAAALVNGDTVQLTIPPSWKRPTGWPLPAVKHQANISRDGHLTCQYRPIDLLDYIDKAIKKQKHPRAKAQNTKEIST